MDAAELVRRLHQHRAWTNRNLLNAATGLPDERLRRTFAIGQGSVWKSLVHLYAAEFVWLEALNGNESPVAPGDLPGMLPGNQQGERPISSLEQLSAMWTELDQRWQTYLGELSDESLDGIVYKVASFPPFSRYGTRRSDVLLHVCTHAQYTTAQIMNMLRQLGVEKLPDVMLISLARQEAASG